MIRFLKWLLAAPFILAFLAFAFANHHSVDVRFNPFDGGDVQNFAIQAPLFAVLIGAIMLGVVLGGAAAWLGQGKYRRAAKLNRADAERFRALGRAAAVAPGAAITRVPPPPA